MIFNTQKICFGVNVTSLTTATNFQLDHDEQEHNLNEYSAFSEGIRTYSCSHTYISVQV